MSSKPSLYVVERKEVVILVVIFILVTVFSFTIGVKYGESIGKKLAYQEMQAKSEVEETAPAGGSLGAHDAPAKKEEHGTPEAKPAHDEKATHEGHDAKPPQAEAKSPEAAATKEGTSPKGEKSVETGSDEHLMGALKDAGIESPAHKNSELPHSAKAKPAAKSGESSPATSGTMPKAGAFVIQVGSHPTKKDAEQQRQRLLEHKLDAVILPPVKDKQGEWYRVTIGSYSNRNSAEKDAKMYKDKDFFKSYFIRKL